MPRLEWDKRKERYYETGTDRGVLYLQNSDGTYSLGTAWNGLTSVTFNPSGGEPTAFWADNAKYLNILSTEELGLTIEAYSYPKDFRVCLGRRQLMEGITVSQQKRQPFGFSFRSKVGNAEDGDDYSYKIHIVYGCMASPSSKSYTTVNDSPEAITLSWEVSTLPIVIEGMKPTSEFVFDGPTYKKNGLMNVFRRIEDILYGSSDDDYILDSAGRNILDDGGHEIESVGTGPHLPTLEEITEIYSHEAFVGDSEDDLILDSNGQKIRTVVPN